MIVKNGKTYVGVVEDNNDPKKLGRVKVRVLDVFDDTPIENIPWANPWKDLSGDEFRIPDNGKIVTVVFENEDSNSPEFIFSDHYNANLEKKLSELNESDYLSTKSLLFDHKTQIYVNDGEGLKIDHKFNLINIKDSSINIALKDNFGRVNIGTENSTQRSILGDNFLNWFDTFMGILNSGAFLTKDGPVMATPDLIACMQQYKSLKNPKFLSKNVYLVDNENVKKLDRISDPQKGDKWKSTTKENDITYKEQMDYIPNDGSSDSTFEQSDNSQPVVISPSENPDIKILLQLLKEKNYKIYENVYQLNIIAIRTQCQNIGDKYTDEFVDKLYLLFKNQNNNWELKQYLFSTVPGVEFFQNGEKTNMKKYISSSDSLKFKNGLPILAPSQYVDSYYMSEYKGEKALITIPGSNQLIWRDVDIDNYYTFNPNNYLNPEKSFTEITISKGYPGGKKVGNWSEGDQVFSNSNNLKEFFDYCEKHKERYGNIFTYTLANISDLNQ